VRTSPEDEQFRRRIRQRLRLLPDRWGHLLQSQDAW